MAENSLTFYRGAATDANQYYAVGYFDDLEAPGEPSPRMRLVRFDRATRDWDILATRDWNAAAISAWQDTTGNTRIAVAGNEGVVLHGPLDGLESEDVDTTQTLQLNAVWGGPDGRAAAGAASAAYVKTAGGAWRSISEGVTFDTIAQRMKTLKDDSDYATVEEYMAAISWAMEGYKTFNAIGGTDLQSLLLAGDNGRLAYWDGSTLDILTNDLNVNLAQMVTTPDGWIVAGSNPTTVVVYVDKLTRRITTLLADGIKRTITGVAFYNDRVIVCGLAPLSGGLMEVGSSGFTAFGQLPQSIWSITATSTGLWALGEKGVFLLDGAGVQTFVSPYL